MAQANSDESASILSGNSANPRAAVSGTPQPAKNQQMVQGAKPVVQEPQMGAVTSLFTDWASI